VHRDYGDNGFASAEECLLMKGLSHPCTYKNPIDDYYQVVCVPGRHLKEWKIEKNQIIVMHGETLHRGKSHEWDGKWHPSVRCAVVSRRYPRKDG
jgi:hypothetical protein